MRQCADVLEVVEKGAICYDYLFRAEREECPIQPV